MEENKLYRVIKLGDVKDAEKSFLFSGYLEELTPPKSLQELEEKVYEWLSKNGNDHVRMMIRVFWDFLKPHIAAMLAETHDKQEQIYVDTMEAFLKDRDFHTSLFNEQISDLQSKLKYCIDDKWKELADARKHVKDLESQLRQKGEEIENLNEIIVGYKRDHN